ncbi:hypothetical protein TEA_008364 [Camellia sinensis var. sinensis]|uniref:AAA+ ATPase domain-containing protein n=1 Tax=Camellia sinensis var. sinensis TaxID=542762 RepID=A0A4V3WLT1_CAMSN|nr:hypothetical protein TEA_008364 [Camellia sinensis var. sinensis]
MAPHSLHRQVPTRQYTHQSNLFPTRLATRSTRLDPLAALTRSGSIRPKQVKDVAHQDEVVRVLTNTLETSNCPHMLFYGPPGTGKTTTALAIAHQLFGPELYKSRVLELNASDDRGINVVRTKIKNFAAVAVGSGRQGGYPCPPFKIIILDEADSMTEDAQASLIIEPLASRCAKFRFKPLSEEIMTSRILHICNEEGLNLDTEALSMLSSISQGDLRRAITYLQGAARLFGSSISSNDLISVSGAEGATCCSACTVYYMFGTDASVNALVAGVFATATCLFSLNISKCTCSGNVCRCSCLLRRRPQLGLLSAMLCLSIKPKGASLALLVQPRQVHDLGKWKGIPLLLGCPAPIFAGLQLYTNISGLAISFNQ